MKRIKPYVEQKETIKVPRFEEAKGFYASKKSSSTMSKIRSNNTKAEVKLRKALWSLGYRYRLHKKQLKGKPDLVFTAKKVVVFIDGDFWHGYNWQERKPRLKTNTEYWIPKIERNMQRDVEVTEALQKEGWKVIRLWEHEVNKNLKRCLETVTNALTASSKLTLKRGG